MSEKKEIKTCAFCAAVADEKDSFCIKCGMPLVNRCTDEKGLIDKGCGHINRSDAAYCAKCGCPTLFKKHGLL